MSKKYGEKAMKLNTKHSSKSWILKTKFLGKQNIWYQPVNEEKFCRVKTQTEWWLNTKLSFYSN